MRYILFISLLYSSVAFAINAPANILRACINNDNLTVTVSWKSPSDICGSFSKHRLYGSEDYGSFNLISEIPSLATTQYSHSLSSINTNWRYYLVTLSTCNGVDSVVSDTLNIDTSYPLDIGLDSVSYDLISQNIIAGWKSNPSVDTDGYQIYDYSRGDGDSIGYTNDTFFTISTNPLNRFPVVIATLDSCNLSSLISSPHTPTFLNSAIDTCDRSINLSWSLYSGWAKIDSQTVYLSINRSPFYSIDTLTGSTNTFTLNNIHLGDTFTFFVRSHNESISSSSNKTTIYTRAFVIPEYTYLNYISVVDNENIELNWVSFPADDIGSYAIQKTSDMNNFNTLNTTTSTQSFIDQSTDVSEDLFYYRIITNNNCDEPVDTSNSSRNVVLRLDTDLTHNSYVGWENGTNSYTLNHKPASSTWSETETSTLPISINSSVLESGCYYVAVDESVNSLGAENRSVSNTVCKKEDLSVSITTGVNPNSDNNTFKIYGTGIDHSKSQYIILNRWGEKLTENPTNIDWDCYYKGELVQPGLYIYIIKLYGTKGEKKTKKGTINVLR